MAPQPKTEQVEAFFGDPTPYLHNNHNLAIRALLVQELLGELAQCRVLDLGCGDGSISAPFLRDGNYVTMLDLSRAMLDRARERVPAALASQVEYVNADLMAFQPDRPYDVVLCIGVLAHVESVPDTLRKIADLSRPGGRCVVQLTDSDRVLGKLAQGFYSARAARRGAAGYALNRTSLAQIRALARSCSLEPLSLRRHSVLLPGMGRLPRRWLTKLDLLVAHSQVLCSLGSSAIILMRKSQDAVTDIRSASGADRR